MNQLNKAGRRLRVLIVDDDHDTLTAMTKLLQASGYDADGAASYADAMKLATDTALPFDLVVCDLGLPDGNGHDLFRDMRTRQSITGIAVSGFDSPEHVDASIAAGFREHLVKPVSIDLVLAAIQRCRSSV